MTRRRVHWVGSQALLVEMDALTDVLALNARLAGQPLAGQLDLVPAARTLLIRFDSHRRAAQAVPSLADIPAPAIDDRAGRQHEIEVVYDGEDLQTVADLTGQETDHLIAAHTHGVWRAAFGGFAPGFVYLIRDEDADPANGQHSLKVPRRDNPRTDVPAGSVALAGHFSAIYPRRSPGGWQLIGRTDARIWDIDRDPPALIQAGDTVRYIAVERFAAGECESSSAGDSSSDEHGEPAIEIIQPGMQSLIEDLGRPGLSHLGVCASGAADESAARQANRLVGNGAGDALIETVLGGLKIRAAGDLVLALTGAAQKAAIEGQSGRRAAPVRRPFLLHDAEMLELRPPEAGLRSYLAVRGGIDVTAVLGSRATDVLSGIGPEPLAAGHMLALGNRHRGEDDPSSSLAPIVGAPEPSTLIAPDSTGTRELRVVLGPRHDWFSNDALEQLATLRWRVTDKSNRVGVRLALADDEQSATPLQRTREDELASEGCVPGAIQVPPAGMPVLFLKDHPVTGGYPVIAVVVTADLAHAAQLAPGDCLRFLPVTPDGRPANARIKTAEKQSST